MTLPDRELLPDPLGDEDGAHRAHPCTEAFQLLMRALWAQLDAGQAGQLADIPDQDSLRGMLLGVISGPARGLACVINAVPSAVARVLAAHADQDGPDDQDED